jgi:hypothetical protein
LTTAQERELQLDNPTTTTAIRESEILNLLLNNSNQDEEYRIVWSSLRIRGLSLSSDIGHRTKHPKSQQF